MMDNRRAEASQNSLEDVQIPSQIAVYVSYLHCNKFSPSLIKPCLIPFFLFWIFINCAELKFVYGFLTW